MSDREDVPQTDENELVLPEPPPPEEVARKPARESRMTSAQTVLVTTLGAFLTILAIGATFPTTCFFVAMATDNIVAGVVVGLLAVLIMVVGMFFLWRGPGTS